MKIYFYLLFDRDKKEKKNKFNFKSLISEMKNEIKH